jgi:glyoxylase-like metal-dependent hydrolase (beta-lactamase superfamily II)
VDPGDYGRLTAPGKFRAGERPPPPPLLEQLARLGVEAEDVTHVVVTHLHFDHFAGVTHEVKGVNAPSFPRARHILPTKDWEMQEIVEAREKGDRDVTDTLDIVEKAGLVELLNGERVLGEGIEIHPSPGESPGHQTVKIGSQGLSCYCVGDLYHMKEEVEHPELSASWADRATLLQTRCEFAKRAAEEAALVLPTHMHPGRISMAVGRPFWSVMQP